MIVNKPAILVFDGDDDFYLRMDISCPVCSKITNLAHMGGFGAPCPCCLTKTDDLSMSSSVFDAYKRKGPRLPGYPIDQYSSSKMILYPYYYNEKIDLAIIIRATKSNTYRFQLDFILKGIKASVRIAPSITCIPREEYGIDAPQYILSCLDENDVLKKINEEFSINELLKDKTIDINEFLVLSQDDVFNI